MSSKVLSFWLGFIVSMFLLLRVAISADVSSSDTFEVHQFSSPENFFENIRHNIQAIVERIRTHATDTIQRLTQRPAIVSDAEFQRKPIWQRLKERLQQPKPTNTTVQPEMEIYYGALSDQFQVDPLEATSAGLIKTPDKINTTLN